MKKVHTIIFFWRLSPFNIFIIFSMINEKLKLFKECPSINIINSLSPSISRKENKLIIKSKNSCVSNCFIVQYLYKQLISLRYDESVKVICKNFHLNLSKNNIFQLNTSKDVTEFLEMELIH